MFGGLAKLGPGSDAETLRILRDLPDARFDVVVDAGCGTGRQTLVLAKELDVPVDAVDRHEPFLRTLMRRAAAAGVESLVRPHCMDMKDISGAFPAIDLLWSEGAAYNIGFADALTGWASAVRPGGFVVVSELAWTAEHVPHLTRAFFASAYPGMRHAADNVGIAERAGYRVLKAHILPRQAWLEGYYDVLAPRARSLADHPDPAARELAREIIREIEVFEASDGSYGYVFYVLQRL